MKLWISLLLTIIACIWGGSFIVVQIIVNEVDPISLGFLRFLVATPIMILLLIVTKKPLSIPTKEVPYLVILGLSGVTFLYVFQYLGVSYTNASTSSVLINTNVIFIVVLSMVFLKEQLTIKRIIGIVLSFIGVLLVLVSSLSFEELTFNNLFFVGSLFILLSALCWAIYSIVGKRLLASYDSFTVTTYAFIIGTLVYVPLVTQKIDGLFFSTSLSVWLGIGYLSIVCTIFGYLGWYHVLKYIDASKAAVYLNFIPVFTIVISLFLGVFPSALFILGAILIIYGVYVTQKN